MQFKKWITDYDHFHKKMGRNKRSNRLSVKAFTVKRGEEYEDYGVGNFRLIMEADWMESGRPYYNVHPCIMTTLSRINLSKIPARLVVVPEPFKVVHIALAKDHPELMLNQGIQNKDGEFNLPKGSSVSGILMFKMHENLIVFCLDFDVYDCYGQPVYVIFLLRTDTQENLQQSIERCAHGEDDYRKVCANALRLAATIGFMANSKSDLIEPDVLSKMKENYRQGDEAQRENIVRKSRQRGKIGFNVGNDLMFLGSQPMTGGASGTGEGRELQYQHIRGGHAHAVRYGPKKSLVKIMWFKPTQVRADLPFREEEKK